MAALRREKLSKNNVLYSVAENAFCSPLFFSFPAEVCVFPFIVNQALASRRGVPSSPGWATQWMGSVGNPCDPSLAPHHP